MGELAAVIVRHATQNKNVVLFGNRQGQGKGVRKRKVVPPEAAAAPEAAESSASEEEDSSVSDTRSASPTGLCVIWGYIIDSYA